MEDTKGNSGLLSLAAKRKVLRASQRRLLDLMDPRRGFHPVSQLVTATLLAGVSPAVLLVLLKFCH